MMLDVALIRHGQIRTDSERRLIGSTNDALGDKGAQVVAERKAAGIYPDADIVYTSGLRRCVETAMLIYFSRRSILTEDGFNAPDYGDFEERELTELGNDKAFREWQASGAETACPNGDAPDDFSERVKAAFRKVCGYAASEGLSSLAIVSHRVVICEILRRHYAPRSNYAHWEAPPGCGYLLQYDTQTSTVQIAGRF